MLSYAGHFDLGARSTSAVDSVSKVTQFSFNSQDDRKDAVTYGTPAFVIELKALDSLKILKARKIKVFKEH
ncbi:MAG: hypothetical protein Kow00121_26450 [Elainellaceae cyanobacterium]